MNPVDHLLTAREGAALLHISVPTFWRRVADAATLSPFRRGPLEILTGKWTLDFSPAFVAAANVADVTQAHHLLHGDEADVFADAGYQGVDKREENIAVPVNWHVAMRPGKRRALPQQHAWAQMLEQAERIKASLRAKVEHPFHVIKNLFRHRKTRYRGLAKNTAQLHTLFAMANLMLARRWVLNIDTRGASAA